MNRRRCVPHLEAPPTDMRCRRVLVPSPSAGYHWKRANRAECAEAAMRELLPIEQATNLRYSLLEYLKTTVTLFEQDTTSARTETLSDLNPAWMAIRSRRDYNVVSRVSRGAGGREKGLGPRPRARGRPGAASPRQRDHRGKRRRSSPSRASQLCRRHSY